MFKLLKSSLRKRNDKDDLIYQSLTLPSRTLEPLVATPLRSKSIHSLRNNGVTLDEELMDWVYDRRKSEVKGPSDLSGAKSPKRKPRRSSFPPPTFTSGYLEEGSMGVLYVRVHQLQYRGKKNYQVKYRLKVASRESASVNLLMSQQGKDIYATFPEEILLFEVDKSFTIQLDLIALQEAGASSAGLLRKLNKRDQFPMKIGSLHLSFPLTKVAKTTDTYVLRCENGLDIKSAESILTIGIQIMNPHLPSLRKDTNSALKDTILYEDLLTIYTRTGSYMSDWVQYRGVMKPGILYLYDICKPKNLISTIPLTHLLEIKTQNPEYAHLGIGCFELAFNRSAFEPFPESDDEELPAVCKIYLMADGQASLEKWMNCFEEARKSDIHGCDSFFISNKYLMAL